jgi:hypothetical protein
MTEFKRKVRFHDTFAWTVVVMWFGGLSIALLVTAL